MTRDEAEIASRSILSVIQYSLRSEDRRVDVSEVAKKFGGGGHRNAAGYQIAP